MIIEMDFVSDWHSIMISEMTAEGLQFSISTRKSSLVIKYFTYLRKKGGQKPYPRLVHKSKTFSCPPELSTRLAQLIDVLEKRQDICPYLSKQVDKISAIDGMFNDWEYLGVLHLHLGDRPDPRDGRYIARTGPLIFAHFMEDDAYLINVYEHGNWTDKSILQTIQDNWPEIIKLFVINGFDGRNHQYTDEEHAEIRNSGGNVMVAIKDLNGGTLVIAPPEHGITTSRDAIHDVRSYDYQVNEIHKVELFVKENHGLFQEAFNENAPDPLRLKLIHEVDKWSIVEQSTGVRFKVIVEDNKVLD